MNWTFYQQHPTDPIRNPISGEFFSTEAVGNVTEALVREAIQNSLDARQEHNGKRVRAEVRICGGLAGSDRKSAFVKC
jgi:hypothetical protein